MYTLYAPIQAIYKESQSLKGLAKMRYDKTRKNFLRLILVSQDVRLEICSMKV